MLETYKSQPSNSFSQRLSYHLQVILRYGNREGHKNPRLPKKIDEKNILLL